MKVTKNGTYPPQMGTMNGTRRVDQALHSRNGMRQNRTNAIPAVDYGRISSPTAIKPKVGTPTAR
jgi:hypothetical protein